MSISNDHNVLSEQVLRTLSYFDIFNYPLRAGEVLRFLQYGTTPDKLTQCLSALESRKQIFRFDDLYSLHAEEGDVIRRRRGNREAEKWRKVAEKKARFIARFPFVRAVMASGSLSKNYMDEKSDLDFFIVTETGRLWIARTLLVLYKRLFLLNSHKHFCVNYFIDTSHLDIEEKNLFTAVELATLIPLSNYPLYEALLRSNRWVFDYFPNYKPRPRRSNGPVSSRLQAICEFLLRPFAPWLDTFFMTVSGQRWKRLYGNDYSKEDFDVAFKTRRHVSKNHPHFYQKRVLDLYRKKLAELDHRMKALTTYD